MARLVCQKLGRPLSEVPYAQLVSNDVRKRIGQITLATATDGNHGRGVAWAAQSDAVGIGQGGHLSRGQTVPGRCEAAEAPGFGEAARIAAALREAGGGEVEQGQSAGALVFEYAES